MGRRAKIKIGKDGKAFVRHKCPHCSTKYQSSLEDVGKWRPCSNCNRTFYVPEGLHWGAPAKESEVGSDEFHEGDAAKKSPYGKVEIKKRLLGGYSVCYECPHCSSDLQSPIDDAGQPDECPDCGKDLLVPGEAERDRVRRDVESRATAKLERAKRNRKRKDPDYELLLSPKAETGEAPIIAFGVICATVFACGLVYWIIKAPDWAMESYSASPPPGMSSDEYRRMRSGGYPSESELAARGNYDPYTGKPNDISDDEWRFIKYQINTQLEPSSKAEGDAIGRAIWREQLRLEE